MPALTQIARPMNARSHIKHARWMAPVLLLPLVEILNSAVEAVVDRVGDERHELSGRAKDMGSAAVAIAIAILGLTWLLILFF